MSSYTGLRNPNIPDQDGERLSIRQQGFGRPFDLGSKRECRSNVQLQVRGAGRTTLCLSALSHVGWVEPFDGSQGRLRDTHRF